MALDGVLDRVGVGLSARACAQEDDDLTTVARIDPSGMLRDYAPTETLPFVRDVPPACASPATAAIFTVAGDCQGRATRATAAAVAICHECPYISDCAEWAISNRETWGVWGGMTLLQRRREIRRRSKERFLASLHNEGGSADDGPT